MEYILLDTSVVSLLHPAKQSSTRRKLYIQDIVEKKLVLSFQTVAELLFWGESRAWNQQKRMLLKKFISNFIIIPYSFDLAVEWARVQDICRKNGRRLESGDCWIATTAVYLDIPLLTHDKDFKELPLENLKVICHAE